MPAPALMLPCSRRCLRVFLFPLHRDHMKRFVSEGRGAFASSSSLSGTTGRFITLQERWHTSVNTSDSFLRKMSRCHPAEQTAQCSRCHVWDPAETRVKAQNNDESRSTWRGCIPVAMPVLPGNNLCVGGVFVYLVLCSFLALNSRMKRNAHKAMVISPSEVCYNELGPLFTREQSNYPVQ